MSIATALTALNADVEAAKAAIEDKGGTAPNGTADMADAIAAIPSGGITPSGAIEITENGTYDVTELAEAVVDVQGGGGGTLPAEYQRCEWIASSAAGQKIVTQVQRYTSIPSIKTKASLEIQTISIVQGTNIIASAGGSSNGGDWFGISNGVFTIGGGDNLPSSVDIAGKHTVDVIWQSDGISISSENTTAGPRITYNVAPANIHLFSTDDYRSNVKLYSCKMYLVYLETELLVGDYVPCYRKSDGVIGLYDLVTEAFYTNSGSGTFTKGADV